VTASVEKSLVKRYNLLGTAYLLAGMLNDSTLSEYLALQMNYEENIYSFATHNGQARWTHFSRIDDAAVSRYPSLRPKKEMLQILSLFYTHNFAPELAVGIASSSVKTGPKLPSSSSAFSSCGEQKLIYSLTNLARASVSSISLSDFSIQVALMYPASLMPLTSSRATVPTSG
jgi:hypothetical protein